jgi:hypothetical protein
MHRSAGNPISPRFVPAVARLGWHFAVKVISTY